MGIRRRPIDLDLYISHVLCNTGGMNDDVFKALGDPTRRAILLRLAASPADVTQLQSRFSFSQPAISQHLRALRDAGIVEAEKRGRRQIYRLRPGGLRPVEDLVAALGRYWEARLDDLGRAIEEEP